MSGSAPKKLLLASYYFPPFNGVAWIRATKFAKYLPEFGWQVQVLTVEPTHYPESRRGVMPGEAAEMDVRRIKRLPLPFGVFLGKLFYPIALLIAAWRDRQSLDAVLLCGSPFHPVLVAGLLRHLVGLPVYADFRDSWSSDPWRKHRRGLRQQVGDWARRSMERMGLVFCDAVSFATDGLRHEYQHKHARLSSRFVTIANGVDLEDTGKVRVQADRQGNSLVLAGKFLFYTPQLGGLLLQVLAARPALRFVYLGEEYREISTLAQQAGLSDRVTTFAQLPYRDSLAHMAAADLGLVTTSNPEGLGTKLFEYLALGKPVLCCVPQGSEIHTRFSDHPGVVIRTPPYTQESLANALDELSSRRGITIELDQQYTRRAGAARLARLLDGDLAGVRGSA